MAAIDTTRTIAASRDGIITTFVATLVGNLITWNDNRLTRKALSQLSARELEDIGLTYADIDQMDSFKR